MKYTKPQVTVLGKAVRVVEKTGMKWAITGDFGTFVVNPPYDLDE